MSRWSRAAITAAPALRGRRAGRRAGVVVAIGDPNPLVNGQGLALRAAGIAVTTGVCQEEALALNAGFISRMSRGLPWVWMKMDGRSALHNGMRRRARTAIAGARAAASC